MGHLTPGGDTIDSRTNKLKKRRLEYDIRGLEVTIFKLENDLLEGEIRIERTHDTIRATQEQLEKKRAELEGFDEAEQGGLETNG